MNIFDSKWIKLRSLGAFHCSALYCSALFHCSASDLLMLDEIFLSPQVK